MRFSLDELDIDEKRELVRMIAQKKAGLIDQDWSEICEMYGLDINVSTLRKAGLGIKLAADANLLCEEAAEGSVAEISDGYVDRQKLRELAKRANTVYRAEARSELLREEIREAIKGLPPIEPRECDCDRVIGEAGGSPLVVALGDFHYGADIRVNGLRGEALNVYNHEVFEERMADALGQITAIIDREHAPEVHVFFVGDLIDGMLRQSQLMRLEYGMVESTMRLAEYLAYWLAELSEFADVHVYACTGNHSEIRPLRSKNREFEDENLEKIIFWYIQERMSGLSDVVFFHGAGQRMVLAEIEGYKFLLLHGDGEKNIDQIAKDAVNMYGEKIDFFICGHKHREQEFPMGMTEDGNSVVIRTPSICGVDRYAQSKGWAGRPGATAMVIEKGYGRRCIYPILL